jgi:hypothetical protein
MADSYSSTSVPKPKSAGWVLGGLSFIPLIGCLFGVIAIIIGAINKTRGQIFLGIAGILSSVLLYGGLFYFGFVAKTGPWASLKIQLVRQIMSTDAGQIALYKNQHGNLPATFSDLGTPSQTNMVFSADPWGMQLKYVPQSNGHFELRSAGPDKVFGTLDDIVATY